MVIVHCNLDFINAAMSVSVACFLFLYKKGQQKELKSQKSKKSQESSYNTSFTSTDSYKCKELIF